MLQIRNLSKITGLDEDIRLHYERVLTDHIRALIFLVSDGAPHPGKGGRAFLMRRLVRETLVSLDLSEFKHLHSFRTCLSRPYSFIKI